MAWEFEIVAGPIEGTTEGPAWNGQALFFTNIPKSRIMRYDPQTGACTEHRTGTNRTNGLAFDAEGHLYGCSAGGRSVVRLEPDGSTTVVGDRFEGRRLNTPNDLALDSKGRVWFTNPWNVDLIGPRDAMDLEDEQVMRADPRPDGSWIVRQLTYDITRPNGILMSQDERTLYVAQAHSDPGKLRELRAYPIREDGSLGLYTVLLLATSKSGTHWEPRDQGLEGGLVSSLRATVVESSPFGGLSLHLLPAL